MSDERLPVTVLNWRETNAIEGRILVHGQDEASGRNYLMLEGTDQFLDMSLKEAEEKLLQKEKALSEYRQQHNGEAGQQKAR